MSVDPKKAATNGQEKMLTSPEQQALVCPVTFFLTFVNI